MRLRRARKVSLELCPLTPITIHYATGSVSRQSRTRHFNLGGFDSPAALRSTFLGIGIRRRRYEQRPPVGPAKHASERIGLDLDSLDDLAALLHSNHFGRRRTGDPNSILRVQANSVGQTVSKLSPYAPIRERSVGRDIERRQAARKGLTDDQRFSIRRDHHPIGEHHIFGN